MAVQTAGSDESQSNGSLSSAPTSHESFIPQYTKKPLSQLDIDGPQQPFDKVQLTKLLIDALQQIGYSETAATLQKESGGILIESTHVKALFTAIKEGKYQDCSLDLLLRLPIFLESLEISGDLSHVALPPMHRKSNEILDHFLTEYEKLTFVMKRLSELKDVDIIKLTICVEILVSIQILSFTDILGSDRRLALELLRSVIRPTISIWDSLRTLQTMKYDPEAQAPPATSGSKQNSPFSYFQPDQLLSQLSTLVACGQSSDDHFVTRDTTAEHISKFINPNDLVPRGRLMQLLKQAIQYQRSRDLLSFHVDDESGENNEKSAVSFNLLQDNVTKSTQFQFENIKTLNRNNDEIWFLQFSSDGRFLASASPSKQYERKIIIYDVKKNFEIYAVCSETRQSVLYLKFSPDNTKLIACSINSAVKIYDLNQLSQPTYDGYLCEYDQLKPIASVFVTFPTTPESSVHSTVTPTGSTETMRLWCADWFHNPELKDFIALGSPDSDVIIYDLKTATIFARISMTMGEDLQTSFPHVHDIKISKDDNDLIVMNNENYIDIFDISTLRYSIRDNTTFMTPRKRRLFVGKRMTGMQFPDTSQYPSDPFLSSLLLVSIQNQELQLWDYQRDILIQKYIGQIQSHFIIRSCFGYHSNFIASGSEDGKIYIWDRFYGNIIGVIPAHLDDAPLSKSKICNIVAWNPQDQTMFASGGDDGLVKVWRVSAI